MNTSIAATHKEFSSIIIVIVVRYIVAVLPVWSSFYKIYFDNMSHVRA